MLWQCTACTPDCLPSAFVPTLHLVNYISQRALPMDEVQRKCWRAKKGYFSLVFSFSLLAPALCRAVTSRALAPWFMKLEWQSWGSVSDHLEFSKGQHSCGL